MRKLIVGVVGAVGIVAAVTACGTTKTVSKAVPGPVTTKIVTETVVRKVPVPGPVTTKTVIKDVPGPTVIKTVIKTVPTPAPTEGTLLDYSGSGTEETPSFTVSGDGDYTVSWTFSGNDSQGDGADNFIVTEDGGNDLNASDDLPNVIQTSGSGNTGVTGDTGSHTFDVQADPTCSWTIKVVSAP